MDAPLGPFRVVVSVGVSILVVQNHVPAAVATGPLDEHLGAIGKLVNFLLRQKGVVTVVRFFRAASTDAPATFARVRDVTQAAAMVAWFAVAQTGNPLAVRGVEAVAAVRNIVHG